MQTPAEQSVAIEQLRKRVGCAAAARAGFALGFAPRTRVSPLPHARRRVLPDDIVVAGDQTAALRRFIVARKGDVDKAEEQLRRALEWRDKGYGVLRVLVRRSRRSVPRCGCAELTPRPRRPSRHGSVWILCAR